MESCLDISSSLSEVCDHNPPHGTQRFCQKTKYSELNTSQNLTNLKLSIIPKGYSLDILLNLDKHFGHSLIFFKATTEEVVPVDHSNDISPTCNPSFGSCNQ